MDGRGILPKQARYQLRYTRLWNCFICGLSCGLGRFLTSGFAELVPASGSVPAGCGVGLFSSWMGPVCSQSRRATNCATPGYEVVGWPGRILPNRFRKIFCMFSFDLRRFRSIPFTFRHPLEVLFPYVPRHSVAETVVRNVSHLFPTACPPAQRGSVSYFSGRLHGNSEDRFRQALSALSTAQNLRDSKQYELPSYSTPAIAAASFCRSFAASRSSKSPSARRSTWEASTPAPGCDPCWARVMG